MTKTLKELLDEGGKYHRANGSVTTRYGENTVNIWTSVDGINYKNTDVYTEES